MQGPGSGYFLQGNIDDIQGKIEFLDLDHRFHQSDKDIDVVPLGLLVCRQVHSCRFIILAVAIPILAVKTRWVKAESE